MTTATDSPEVRRYLDDLRRLLGDAPDRDLVVEGVERHIDDALGGSADPARVAAVLDELGDPAVIAAEAAPSAAPSPDSAVPFLERRTGVALIVLLLAFGGFVVPVIGWVAGVVLLWMSRAWSVPDKLIGTLGVPVLSGVVVAVGIALAAAVGGGGHTALLLSVPAASILVAAYLLIRFRRAG